MKRIASVMLATAVVSAISVSSAHAAGAAATPYLGSLDFGPNGQFIPSVTPGTAAFAYEATFDLAHDSTLTGTFYGISSGAATLTESWFSELSGQTESRTWFRSIVFDETPFELGTLPQTTGVIGFSSSTYKLSLSGVMKGEYIGTGVPFVLSVQQPVPEPGTWGLMALGLLGMGVVARRRTQA